MYSVLSSALKSLTSGIFITIHGATSFVTLSRLYIYFKCLAMSHYFTPIRTANYAKYTYLRVAAYELISRAGLHLGEYVDVHRRNCRRTNVAFVHTFSYSYVYMYICLHCFNVFVLMRIGFFRYLFTYSFICLFYLMFNKSYVYNKSNMEFKKKVSRRLGQKRQRERQAYVIICLGSRIERQIEIK